MMFSLCIIASVTTIWCLLYVVSTDKVALWFVTSGYGLGSVMVCH